MATKTKIKKSIGQQIKDHLKRNQRWLASEIGMSQPELSTKINGFVEFTDADLIKINEVLGTNFKNPS